MVKSDICQMSNVEGSQKVIVPHPENTTANGRSGLPMAVFTASYGHRGNNWTVAGQTVTA